MKLVKLWKGNEIMVMVNDNRRARRTRLETPRVATVRRMTALKTVTAGEKRAGKSIRGLVIKRREADSRSGVG